VFVIMKNFHSSSRNIFCTNLVRAVKWTVEISESYLSYICLIHTCSFIQHTSLRLTITGDNRCGSQHNIVREADILCSSDTGEKLEYVGIVHQIFINWRNYIN
jgi:hypothetical protein